MAEFEIIPIPEENYKGRQYGYQILMDGLPYFRCSTGGTGDCWNIGEAPQYEGDDVGDLLHICELDEAIGALTALRDSEAHRLNVERWS